MEKNQFIYQQDKITKNTVRYQPDAAAQKLLGQATIYIQQTWLESIGMRAGDELIITIEKKV